MTLNHSTTTRAGLNWPASVSTVSIKDIYDPILRVSHCRLPVSYKFSHTSQVPLLFASRDFNGIERIYETCVCLDTLLAETKAVHMVLDYNKLPGTFDDNGVCPCSLLNDGKKDTLYFCGWNIHKKVPFSCALGVAERISGQGCSFIRKFPGPILERNLNDPIFVAVNDVIRKNGRFMSMYLSCKEWSQSEIPNSTALLHKYAIKWAESEDGNRWDTTPEFCIDFCSDKEYAISTPRICQLDSLSLCFYSYRGHNDGDFYKIGLAVLTEGGKWLRIDKLTSNICINNQLNPKEVCYPWPIIYGENLLLMHNGERYGASGIWSTSIPLAKLKDSVMNALNRKAARAVML